MTPSWSGMRWRTGSRPWPRLGPSWGSLTSLLFLLLSLFLWITFWWSFLSLWHRRFRFRSFWDITIKKQRINLQAHTNHNHWSNILEADKMFPNNILLPIHWQDVTDPTSKLCKELEYGTVIQRQGKVIIRLSLNLLGNKMTLSEAEKMPSMMKQQWQISSLPLEFYTGKKKSYWRFLNSFAILGG